jgi:hypothetical protein
VIDSSVGTATRLRAGRSSRVRFLEEAGNISLRHGVQTGSGAHPDSYPMGKRGSFPGGKADNSPSFSAKVKECRAIPPLPNTPLWRGAQLKRSTGTTSSIETTDLETLL